MIFALLLIFFVILVFNFIIFFHELGHFLAAKWRGMEVDRFQIWFGKPFIKKTIGGVQYGIGTIPLGGFVSLPQMAPMEAIEGKKLEEGEVSETPRTPVKPIDKIIVAFAGPLFSFLLAFLCALVLWKVGNVELPVISTEIGYVQAGSPAEKAGFLLGDEILEIAGEKPVSFDGSIQAVTSMIALSSGEQIEFKVKRGDEVKTLMSGYKIPDTKWYERRAMRTIGIGAKEKVFVGSVQKYSPAEKAGLKVMDEIIAVNGTPIFNYGAIVDVTRGSDEPVVYTYKREGEVNDVTIEPRFPDIIKNAEKRKMIGIGFGQDPEKAPIKVYPTPWFQMKEGATIMWISLQKVISPKTSIGVQHFTGPIGMVGEMYGLMKTPYAVNFLCRFLVIININLAIMNLLPIPVLDGGHIMLALGELITGKTPKLKILEVVQSGVVIFFMTLFLFIATKDIGDRVRPKPVLEFLP